MNDINTLWGNLDNFLKECAKQYDKEDTTILEIGPSTIHKTIKDYFSKTTIKTLDFDPNVKSDYTCDLCRNNSEIIADGSFDYIACCEVLEHVNQPFDAMEEIHRILKPEGRVFISVPFNLMIHTPYPDNWRFTEMGLKVLCKNFNIETIKFVGRAGMPIQYTLIAEKK